jgi:hypothetical protein
MRKSSIRFLVAAVSLVTGLPTVCAHAQVKRQASSPHKDASSEAEGSHNWYVRIQQLPLLGMATVSDTGVVDVEFMRKFNKNFHLGPTVVYHFDKSERTQMQSLNLGIRGDLILPDAGFLGDIYLSSALFAGVYESTRQVDEFKETGSAFQSCTTTSQGLHRVGAFAAGKIFTLSESIHMTVGMGMVKSRTMGREQSESDCQQKNTQDGVTLPWFDFGVGFGI